MAKDLPFFKFKPGQWSAGSITTCELNTQGLFINLCSLYWSKQGVLDFAKAQKRFKDKDAWQELIDEEIIQINEGHVIIDFLDEQFDEREVASGKAREAANKRWKKDSDSPESDDSMQTHADACKPNADSLGEHAIKKREEEKREEKKRAEEKRALMELHEEACEMARPVAQYFSVSEVGQHQKFAVIVEFCKQLIRNSQKEFFETQFDYYKRYKSVSEEQKHNLANYLGIPPDYGGAWNECTWQDKLEAYKPRHNGHQTPQITFDKND